MIKASNYRSIKQPISITKSAQACYYCFTIFSLVAILLCLLFLSGRINGSAAAWQTVKPWLACWRFSVFVMVVAAWPYWVKTYAHWACLDTEQYQRALNYRWRTALMLLVIELILVQHGLAWFIT